MRVYNVIIEPLEERYSIQWHKWWSEGFANEGVSVSTIIATALTDKIETGSFLDAHSTIFWKAGQLQTIVKLLKQGVIQDNDVLFFHDLWFPGIEGLGYIRDISKVNFKIAGYLHAGAYDPADLLHQVNMQRWVSGCERSWVELADFIFVGSDYHKEMLEKLCGKSLINKVYPIGYPVDKGTLVGTSGINPVPFSERENIVVFPHRMDKEKNPHIFTVLEKALLDEGIDAKFVFTKLVCKNKSEYYAMLSKAKVSISTADQETFGIAMVESALLGAIPIAPNKLSYLDTMPVEWRYDNMQELIALTKKALNTKQYTYHREEDYSVSSIVKKVLEKIKG